MPNIPEKVPLLGHQITTGYGTHNINKVSPALPATSSTAPTLLGRVKLDASANMLVTVDEPGGSSTWKSLQPDALAQICKAAFLARLDSVVGQCFAQKAIDKVFAAEIDPKDMHEGLAIKMFAADPDDPNGVTILRANLQGDQNGMTELVSASYLKGKGLAKPPTVADIHQTFAEYVLSGYQAYSVQADAGNQLILRNDNDVLVCRCDKMPSGEFAITLVPALLEELDHQVTARPSRAIQQLQQLQVAPRYLAIENGTTKIHEDVSSTLDIVLNKSIDKKTAASLAHSVCSLTAKLHKHRNPKVIFSLDPSLLGVRLYPEASLQTMLLHPEKVIDVSLWSGIKANLQFLQKCVAEYQQHGQLSLQLLKSISMLYETDGVITTRPAQLLLSVINKLTRTIGDSYRNVYAPEAIQAQDYITELNLRTEHSPEPHWKEIADLLKAITDLLPEDPRSIDIYNLGVLLDALGFQEVAVKCFTADSTQRPDIDSIIKELPSL